MRRVLIHVEGQSEEQFVNEVLAPHLLSHGVSATARLLGNARLRRSRGGIKRWDFARKEIVNHLRAGLIVTTMVDYYALPRDWPGRDLPGDAIRNAPKMLELLHDDVAAAMGRNFDGRRFVPNVIVHEFEGLLFSDCDALSRGIYRPDLKEAFVAIRRQFASPEEINDSPETAPSKRLKSLDPEYDKALTGSLAALEIGLDCIRRECQLFNQWLTALEVCGEATW